MVNIKLKEPIDKMCRYQFANNACDKLCNLQMHYDRKCYLQHTLAVNDQAAKFEGVT